MTISDVKLNSIIKQIDEESKRLGIPSSLLIERIVSHENNRNCNDLNKEKEEDWDLAPIIGIIKTDKEIDGAEVIIEMRNGIDK